MTYTTRLATAADAPFMWQMLYIASHMADGHEPFEGIYDHPELARYMSDWPRVDDLGVVAYEIESGELVGAAWFRILIGDEKTDTYIDEATPELAIGIKPEHQGHGIGTLMLQHLLAEAQAHYPAVSLSVRDGNPAIRLYERQGFQTIGQVVNRVGTMSFVMVRHFS
jgi:ribosomal protein S18 acetylase RimI-like enzyme